MSGSQKRQAVVFPEEMKILQQLGENIRLAMKRRRITQTMVAERTGLSKPTLRNIERGEPTVSIGHYLRVLAVLGLAEDLGRVALDDELGRKLQDIALQSPRPTTRRTGTSVAKSDKPSVAERYPSDRVKLLMKMARDRAGDLTNGQVGRDGEAADE
ncbi:helix-turn-helix domain-containing protein [Thalassolituus sp. LLYu03]|uniref:helix-turn-helix domain-containing protein n=1 Tax=Thalassolituus sp. LLYu03 TaxID=3421656 RepID=UPI003D2AF92B